MCPLSEGEARSPRDACLPARPPACLRGTPALSAEPTPAPRVHGLLWLRGDFNCPSRLL